MRGSTAISDSSRKVASLALLALAVAFTAVSLLPQFIVPSTHYSDVALHVGILESLDRTIRSGGNPLDFWFDLSPFGYPLFRTYQHLPHLAIYGLYRAAGGYFTFECWIRITTYLLMCGLPLSVFWGARLLGLELLAAAWAALFSVLVSESGSFGLGLHNYQWGSGGIVTQLWAVLFLFPAIGAAARYMREGQGLPILLLLGFMTAGCHLNAAVIMLVSIALHSAALLSKAARRDDRIGQVRRFFVLCALIGIATSYQWVILLLDRAQLFQSQLEPSWKFASHGIRWVWTNLWNGDLFDADRFPALTIFVLVGLAFSIVKPARGKFAERDTFLALGFVTWLVLLCGWEVWGFLSNLPVLSSFQSHRLIVAVNAFGVLLAGRGAAELSEQLLKRSYAVLFVLLLVIPALRERWIRFEASTGWLRDSAAAESSDRDLSALMSVLETLPRGWVHVGMEKNWARELMIGRSLRLRMVTISAGIPTFGQLFHPFSVAGDVMYQFDPSRESHYRILGIRYTVAPPRWIAPAFLVKIGEFGRFHLYELPSSHMLETVRVAFSVTDARDARLKSKLNTEWFGSDFADDLSLGAFRSEPGDLPSMPVGARMQSIDEVSTSPGAVLSSDPWTPERMLGRVRLDEDGYVLFKNGYHPQWFATVDGKRVEPELVTPGFMAVRCPKGEHSVSFEYRAGLLKPFLLLSGVVTMLGCWIFCRRSVD